MTRVLTIMEVAVSPHPEKECAYPLAPKPVKTTMTVTQTKERCVATLARVAKPVHLLSIVHDSVRQMGSAILIKAKLAAGHH